MTDPNGDQSETLPAPTQDPGGVWRPPIPTLLVLTNDGDADFPPPPAADSGTGTDAPTQSTT